MKRFLTMMVCFLSMVSFSLKASSAHLLRPDQLVDQVRQNRLEEREESVFPLKLSCLEMIVNFFDHALSEEGDPYGLFSKGRKVDNQFLLPRHQSLHVLSVSRLEEIGILWDFLRHAQNNNRGIRFQYYKISNADKSLFHQLIPVIAQVFETYLSRRLHFQTSIHSDRVRFWFIPQTRVDVFLRDFLLFLQEFSSGSTFDVLREINKHFTSIRIAFCSDNDSLLVSKK